MMHGARTRRTPQAAALIISLIFATPLDADVIWWAAPQSGFFNQASNWSPQQVPGPNDKAMFDTNAGSDYTVGFTTSVTNSRVVVKTDRTLFNLGGMTYSIGSNGGLTVGEPGDSAKLTLAGGGTLAAENTIMIGDQSTARLDVIDGGTVLTTQRHFHMANSEGGQATVNIAQGAHLDVGLNLSIADDFAQQQPVVRPSGALNISGPVTTVDVHAWALFGTYGTAFVNIDGRAVVTVDGGTILGNEPGSVGFMTLRDEGTFYDGTEFADVGNIGQGTLRIENGADMLIRTVMHVGSQPGSDGTMIVTGPGSTLTVDDFHDVPYDGTGEIVVSNAGTVVARNFKMATVAGSSGTGVVSGFGSTLTGRQGLAVGWEGEADLTVENEGQALVTEDFNLHVGWAGTGTLTVRTGGRVRSDAAEFPPIIGSAENSVGVVTVRDPGSELRADSVQIQVGREFGAYGELRIENQALVSSVANQSPTSSAGIIGTESGSTGIVTINDSHWNCNEGSMNVGFRGDGTLAISNGGLVTSTGANIARFAGSTGHATISGPTSAWTCTGSFNVGEGASGVLTLEDGATVSASSMFIRPNGSLRGEGTVNANMNMLGEIAPGSSAGLLDINGAVFQGDSTVTRIELGGTAPGTGYDQVNISGNALLDGTLIVTLINGFDPQIGDRFEIITTGGTLTGEFDVTSLPEFPGDERFFTITYEGGGVVLEVFGLGGDVGFDPPEEFESAGAGSIERAGDLDSNGLPDNVIVIPNADPQLPGFIQVFRNQGNAEGGTWQGFLSNVEVEVGLEPSGVAVGLFDNDVHFDLAVTNAGDDTILVFLNDGTGQGTFLAPSTIVTGSRPSAIAAGDFNEDSFIDLAVTNEADDSLQWFAGDGLGNFALVQTLPVGGMAPLRIEPEDIDNDKCLDIIGVGRNQQQEDGPSTPGFAFVFHNTSGLFDPAVTYPVGVNPTDITGGDLDRDAFADLAVTNADDGTVSILLNRQDGTFRPASFLAVGESPTSVDAVDLDGDLDLDLAVAAIDPGIGPAVQVLRNIRVGVVGVVFEEPIAFGVEADPNFVINSELNEDEAFDLITVNADPQGKTGGSITVLLNDPCPIGCAALPLGFETIFGAYESGNLNALYASDDIYVRIEQRPGVSPLLPLIRMQIDAVASLQDVSELSIIVEAAANSLPNQPPQRISLFDYDQSRWEVADERIATLADSVVEVTYQAIPSRFIQLGTKEMAMRLEWFTPGNVISPNWGVRVDQAVWLVLP